MIQIQSHTYSRKNNLNINQRKHPAANNWRQGEKQTTIKKAKKC